VESHGVPMGWVDVQVASVAPKSGCRNTGKDRPGHRNAQSARLPAIPL
jgi:hypothetical protein